MKRAYKALLPLLAAALLCACSSRPVQENASSEHASPSSLSSQAEKSSDSQAGPESDAEDGPSSSSQAEISEEDLEVPLEAPEEVFIFEGEIADATMNTLTLKNADGASVTFSTAEADKSGCDGLEIGTKARVYYTGELGEGETASVRVVRVEQNF